MRLLNPFLMLVIVASIPTLAQQGAGQDQELRNNPFVWPKTREIPKYQHKHETRQVGSSAIKPGRKTLPPVLRSIMVGSDVAMVNVDGEVLRVGQQYHGYRLQSVTNDTAVFIKDGKKLTLTLDSTLKNQLEP